MLVDSKPSNSGFHAKYILHLRNMLFHLEKVVLKGFRILPKILLIHYLLTAIFPLNLPKSVIFLIKACKNRAVTQTADMMDLI